MTFKIYYNGNYEDDIVVEGETIEEIKENTFVECARRGWEHTNCWSEKVG